MVKKCGPACPEQPDHHKPAMPPIEPLVSVSSVNGMQGDVVLKDLIIGNKHYNGSDQKQIYASDLGLEKAFVYCGSVKTIEAAEAKMADAECGDVYFCKEDQKFYLSVGEGDFKTFNDAIGKGEPDEYIKKAIVSGNTLKLQDKDGNIVEFVPNFSEYRKAGEQDIIDEVLQGEIEYNATMQETFTTTVTVGNVPAGTVIDKNKLIVELLKDMLTGEAPVPPVGVTIYKGIVDAIPTTVEEIEALTKDTSKQKADLLANPYICKRLNPVNQYVVLAVNKDAGLYVDKVLVGGFQIGIIEDVIGDYLLYHEELPVELSNIEYDYYFEEE